MATTIKKNIAFQNQQTNTSNAEQSISNFFDILSKKLDQICNPPSNICPPVEDIKFKTYTQAYQGFAQNNVSKREGFSIKVDVVPDYYIQVDQIIN